MLNGLAQSQCSSEAPLSARGARRCTDEWRAKCLYGKSAVEEHRDQAD
jgi:hypothetical protein